MNKLVIFASVLIAIKIYKYIFFTKNKIKSIRYYFINTISSMCIMSNLLLFKKNIYTNVNRCLGIYIYLYTYYT